MRVRVDLDRELLETAIEMSGGMDKNQVVEAALRELIAAKRRRSELQTGADQSARA